jgi:catechol 2,3-dioxygenase-like lactoylglutathione lyase family enzyme
MPQPPLTPELACFDFKLSLDFYTRALGFNILYQRPEEGFAMLEREGAQLMIDAIGEGRTWAAGELQKPLGRGMNLQIETKDVDALYRKAKSANAPIFLEMEEKWYRGVGVYMGNRQFIVQDPDGYLLRFYQDLGAREKPE